MADVLRTRKSGISSTATPSGGREFTGEECLPFALASALGVRVTETFQQHFRSMESR